MSRPPHKPKPLPLLWTTFETSRQRSPEHSPWNHASPSSSLSRRTTCHKLCLPMWIRPVRRKNQRHQSTGHNMRPLRPIAHPNAGKQVIRATLVHTPLHHNPTLQTSFTPPTQYRRHQPLHHNTTETNRQHNHGLVHHPTDRHNWPTLKHLPLVSPHLIRKTTHNPPTTRQTHSTCLPPVPENHPLPTQHTWHRLNDGSPMGRRHDLEQPFFQNKCPSRIKYPPDLFTGTFSTSPRSRRNIYSVFVVYQLLS